MEKEDRNGEELPGCGHVAERESQVGESGEEREGADQCDRVLYLARWLRTLMF